MLTEIIFNVFQRSMPWPGLEHGTSIILVGMENTAEEVRISVEREWGGKWVHKVNFAMKNKVLGRTEMSGSDEDDEETPTSTGGFPACSPLAMFGHNGVTWGSQSWCLLQTLFYLCSTLWTWCYTWKPKAGLFPDATVENSEVQPGNSNSEKVNISYLLPSFLTHPS